MSPSEILSAINGFVWGAPTILLLFGGAVYIMVQLRFLPIRRLGAGWREMFRKESGSQSGELLPLRCLTTALSATIGTGNIVGVITAITLGGPGAIFWMWMIAIFGTALKYSEAVLAVCFRRVTSEGEYHGGPMYYIERGLGPQWKWMAMLYALLTFFTSFFIGNTIQANSVADAVHATFGVSEHSAGLAIAVLGGLVIVGGLKSIGAVASKLIPLMVFLYIGTSLYILLTNYALIPGAFATIISSAFTGHAATGGFVGAGIILAIQTGAARGLFSNEAGMGSASIAHAAANTHSPVRQGQIAALGPVIDTLVVCTMTALVIVISGVWTSAELEGAAIATAVYDQHIPFGGAILTSALAVFAFTTVLGWSVYGERALRYMVGPWASLPFRIVWIIALYIGATSDLQTVWKIADTTNGLMIWPNMIALIMLCGVVAAATRGYENGVAEEVEYEQEIPQLEGPSSARAGQRAKQT